MHNSSRLPVGQGKGAYPSGFGMQSGRLSALPRNGSSSVFYSLEEQRTISSQELPGEYVSSMPFRPGPSKLRSTSSMLPAPPGFGLPRANERRIRDQLQEKSNTSIRSSSDDDFEDDEEDAADGRHVDGNPPRERKNGEIKPMQPIASMANFSKLSSAAAAANRDSSSNFSDLWGKSSELLANTALAGAAGPSGQSPPLSAILRALFPNWFTSVIVPAGGQPGMWSAQPLANAGAPSSWASPGQYSPYSGPYGPNNGSFGGFPPGQGYR